MKILRLVILFCFLFQLFGCEREVSTSPDVSVIPTNSKLFIDSEPPGALIYLNGKITGKETPDTLFWLQDTIHQVRLKKSYYRDTVFSMQSVENELISINIKYHDNPDMLGRINCITNPEDAEIIIDGQRTGEYTPHVIEGLIPGNYTISFLKDKYRASVIDYLVTSNETVGNTVALEDTSVWVTYTKDNSELPENEVWSVTVDRNNVTWIGTATSGLVKYQNGKFSTIPMTYFGMEDVAIYKMSVDSSNIIWLGTSEGVIRYTGNSYEVFNTDNSELPGDGINNIAAHYDTKLWVSTNYGAGVYENSGWTVYNRTNSEISGNFINVVNTNVSGEVWIGFARDGLAIWNGIRFKPITNFGWPSGPTAPALPGNTVYAIAQESNGMVWVGFYPEDFPGGGAGGLTTYNGNTWSNRYNGQLSKQIYDIVITPDDVKLVATSEGLTKFKEWAGRRFYRTENSGLYSNYIQDLELDREGNLWMATKSGVTKYKIKNEN